MADRMYVADPGSRAQPGGLWRRFGRPVLAWLGSGFAAAFVLVILMSLATLADPGPSAEDAAEFFWTMLPATGFFALFVLALTALPWLFLVWAMRIFLLPRGAGDLVAGAVMGGGLVQLYGLPLFRGSPEGFLLTLVFLLAGAAGGLAYWWGAGRPDRAAARAAQAAARARARA
ncbi:hypothetical protein [Maricaulis sp. CAU 1757]